LELNEQLSRTRLEHEKTAFVRQIEAVEAGVDALANEMYGLDKTDVQMIESAV
jgi:hypothetical protein